MSWRHSARHNDTVGLTRSYQTAGGKRLMAHARAFEKARTAFSRHAANRTLDPIERRLVLEGTRPSGTRRMPILLGF